MCFYERITFTVCGHDEKRLIRHCHFARNDPGHQCFGAWRYDREWTQGGSKCSSCVQAEQRAIRSGGSPDSHE
ncbi:hypothetical protein BDU57DRAFT_441629 [Ampelomyces quisqualis]|uniref:Uncharacterized protein n=1 Tax=Ampelomyces quisqualis TaxID=50730 RepID=A0A6A5R1G1_AMPQU|nr:hypothetical protein BDU57DRAFT_441629 [Ampelomyces quisqualis]